MSFSLMQFFKRNFFSFLSAPFFISYFFLSFSALLFASQSPPNPLTLSVDKYVDAVLKNNLQAKLSKINVSIKHAIYEEQIKANSSGTLSAGYNEKYSDEITREGRDWKVNWKYKVLESGTQFDLGFKQRQFQLSALLDKQWTSEVTFDVNQPLLPFDFNEFRLLDTRKVDAYRFDLRSERANYNFAVASLVRGALATYWEYVIYTEDYAILKANYRSSQELLVFEKKKARLGTISKSALLASEALLLQEKTQLQNTEKKLENLKQKMLNFMGYDPSELSPQAFEIVLEPPPQQSQAPLPNEEEAAYQTALNNREELRLLRIGEQSAKNSLATGKLYLQPNLNFLFGGSFFNTETRFDCAFCGASFDWEHVELRWGLTFSMYTDVLSYKVPTARPLLLIEQAKQKYQDKKNEIRVEIQDRLRSVEQAYQTLKNSEEIKRLQTERYQIGIDDYNKGKIGASERVRYQNDLRNAQKSYLNSKYSYQIALVNLQFSKGTLLEDYSFLPMEPQASLKEASPSLNKK